MPTLLALLAVWRLVIPPQTQSETEWAFCGMLCYGMDERTNERRCGADHVPISNVVIDTAVAAAAADVKHFN